MLRHWLLWVLDGLAAWVRSPYFYSTVLLLLAFWQFWDLTVNVVTEDEITLYDRWIVQGLARMQNPALDQWAVRVTDLASWPWVVGVVVLGFAGLWWRRRHRQAWLLLAAPAGGYVLMEGLKRVFDRPRPLMGLVEANGYSFPSGHATVAVCLYGVFIILLLLPEDTRRGWRRLLVALLLGLIGLIGLSRVYLGVHYPSDVLAGFLLGVFWTAACFWGYQRSLHDLDRFRVRQPG